jgi:hypothetical protein
VVRFRNRDGHELAEVESGSARLFRLGRKPLPVQFRGSKSGSCRVAEEDDASHRLK